VRTRSIGVVAVACLAVASAFLTGCGPKTPSTGPTRAAPGASPSPIAPAVKDLTVGNCTLYPKTAAVSLLGGSTGSNKNLEIGTDGGTKIDVCSYLNFKGATDLEAASYAVVRYDSAATAFAEAQKVQTQMLGSAASNNWPVQSLTTPAPGSGQVLGGYGTKTDSGIAYTMAVVGTNVGPYLVVALGASTESPDNAKKFALAVFGALSSAVS